MLLIIFLRLLIIFRKIDIVFDTTILLAKFGIIVTPFLSLVPLITLKASTLGNFETFHSLMTLKASPLSNRGVRLGVPPADESK